MQANVDTAIDNWKWSCPVCGGNYYDEVCTVDDIRAEWVGATIDCIDCGSTLIINEDLTCSDFLPILVKDVNEWREKQGMERKQEDFGFASC